MDRQQPLENGTSNHVNGVQENHYDLSIYEEEKLPLEDDAYKNDDEKSLEVDIQEDERVLIYRVSEVPPPHITLISGLQHGLMGLIGQLKAAMFVAVAVCATENDVIKARILSTTLFMDGVTTILMVMIGARLPLFQGASSMYIIPLMVLGSLDDTFCAADDKRTDGNGTLLVAASEEKILANLQSLQGSLMLAGGIHALVGMTGIVGLLLRFIGPITIVPAMILGMAYAVKPSLMFIEVHWGIALMTMVSAIILSLYLGKYQMPVPVWTPSGGFRIVKYPVHQVFSILIAIIIGWLVCALLTYLDVYPKDPSSPNYKTRTDAQWGAIASTPWFTFPYPGQYGPFSFSAVGFVAFIIATAFSIIDSIGDYYACARVSRVPPPPPHAVNRGIMVEGLCSFLAGCVGCSHATTTYGGNIGAIGITRVASRYVFVALGLLYILFAVVGKFSAFFITIPYPVLGGALITLIGLFTGVALSNLQVVNLASSRNLAIIGIGIFFGLTVTTWIQNNQNAIQVGGVAANRLITMILGNPMLAGTLAACFMDNTVPGTLKERGMLISQVTGEDEEDQKVTKYEEGYEVYAPWLPSCILRSRLLKYIPFLPDPDGSKQL